MNVFYVMTEVSLLECGCAISRITSYCVLQSLHSLNCLTSVIPFTQRNGMNFASSGGCKQAFRRLICFNTSGCKITWECQGYAPLVITTIPDWHKGVKFRANCQTTQSNRLMQVSRPYVVAGQHSHGWLLKGNQTPCPVRSHRHAC